VGGVGVELSVVGGVGVADARRGVAEGMTSRTGTGVRVGVDGAAGAWPPGLPDGASPR
jgi:hypothetical protein